MSGEGFILKPYRVFVTGFDSYVWPAKSRQMALSQAWRSFCSYRDDVSFGDFLKMAKAIKDETPSRFGEEITVAGLRAFYVSHNSQYIQFVRPGSDVVLHSHPLDVLPIEARRGTPYAAYPITGIKEPTQ